MATTNNFDSASCGLNLELSIFKDTDQSQRLFSESFKVLQHSGYRTNTIAVYTDCGNFSDEFSFSDSNEYSFTKADLVQAMKKAGFWDQETARYKGYNLYRDNKALLLEFAEEQCGGSSDFADFLQENFTAKYETIVTRGCCQGDYAEVIIPSKTILELEKQCGKAFSAIESGWLSDYIDNLFWDSPVWARLEVNDQELYLDELIGDLYNYDKDQLLVKFIEVYSKDYSEEQFKIIVDFLTSNLPEYPNYQ
jgi:hypothetical protein